jgi:DNA (cytosine-5)-methyltransferase 1
LAAKSGAFLKDPRNVLYRRAIQFVQEFRPKAFIFENVAGILHLRGNNMAEVVCEGLAGSGYEVSCAVLNSAWFGVPQARDRVFIIGIRSDLGTRPKFPEIRHDAPDIRGLLSTAQLDADIWEKPQYFVPYKDLPRIASPKPAVCVREAFEDLPSFTQHLRAQRQGRRLRTLRELVGSTTYRHEPQNDFAKLMRQWPGFESDIVLDHYCRWTPRDFETFRAMRPGDRYPEALAIAIERYEKAKRVAVLTQRPRPKRADFVPPYRNDGFRDKWRKLIPSLPSWTVTAHLGKDGYSHIHPDGRQARSISPREAARLQSFPDGFKFVGSTGEVFTQVGNAVPPLMAEAVARSVIECLTVRQATRAA